MMWWLYFDMLVALVASYKIVYLCHFYSYTVTVCCCAHVVTVQFATRYIVATSGPKVSR